MILRTRLKNTISNLVVQDWNMCNEQEHDIFDKIFCGNLKPSVDLEWCEHYTSYTYASLMYVLLRNKSLVQLIYRNQQIL